jgi:Sulfatase
MSTVGDVTREMPAARAQARERGAAAARTGSRRDWWRSTGTVLLHLGGLWAIAYVQPLFDLLGKNAAFFVARDNTASDILIFALAFALVPPLVMTALVALGRAIHRRVGQALLLGFVAVLVAGLALQILKRLAPGGGEVLLVLSLLVGALAAFAYERFTGLKSLLTILGAAPAVVLAFFLLFSPVNEILMPGDAKGAVTAGSRSNGTPVVLMVFDEFPTMSLMDRNERVDPRKYPAFARLAKQATWYRNTTGAADGTYVGVPAILTGLRPLEKLPTDRSYPKNIFSLVGRTYDINAQEPITHVCSTDLCGKRARASQSKRLSALFDDLKVVEERLVLPKTMTSGLPPIDRDWEDFGAQAGEDGLAQAAENQDEAAPEAVTAGSRGIRVAGNDLPAQRLRRGRAVVRTMKPGRKPGLWFVHYVVPHIPWRFLPDGTQYVVSGGNMPGLTDQTWNRNRFTLDQAWQRHFLMSRFADNLLAEAIAKMKATGLWDKALVIVTADHGGAILPGGSRRPVTKDNFAPIAGVPLFVKAPGQRIGKIDDGPARTIDVMPTVAKTLGIDNGWKFDGVPLDEPHNDVNLFMRNGRRAKYARMSLAGFERQRTALLRDQLDRFPTYQSIWRIGPRPSLLGRAVSGLSQVGATNASVTVDASSLYGRVNHASGVLPVYVTGRVRNLRPGTPIAVAVNGRIRATAETYGGARYSALVPPSYLRRGRNRIEVFQLVGGGLRPLVRIN